MILFNFYVSNIFLQLPKVSLSDNAEFSQLSCEVDFGQEGNAYGTMTLTVVGKLLNSITNRNFRCIF